MEVNLDPPHLAVVIHIDDRVLDAGLNPYQLIAPLGYIRYGRPERYVAFINGTGLIII